MSRCINKVAYDDLIDLILETFPKFSKNIKSITFRFSQIFVWESNLVSIPLLLGEERDSMFIEFGILLNRLLEYQNIKKEYIVHDVNSLLKKYNFEIPE